MTEPAEQLTQQHRAQQVAIAAGAVRQLVPLWRVLDPANLDGTAGDWVDATLQMIAGMYDRSRQLAQDYLGAVRTLDIGLAPRPHVPAVALNERAVRASLMVTGPVAIKQRTRALTLRARQPGADQVSIDTRIRTATSGAFVDVAGATMRHTLAGGRDAMLADVAHDKQALGWVRRSDGDPCFFCAMLISRGPIYKGQSFAESDPRFIGDGEFKVHDHDGCTLRPVYRGDLNLDDVDRWARLWETSGAKQLSGRDAINAFRRAYDAQRGTTPPPPVPPSPGPGGGPPATGWPPAGSTADPASLPVSNALTLASTAPRFTAAAQHALGAIAAVHGDGNLPPIPFRSSSSTTSRGEYRFLGGHSVSLEMNPGSTHPAFTAVHEIGHFLDHQGFATPWASKSNLIADVLAAAHASPLVQSLRTMNVPQLVAGAIPGSSPSLLQSTVRRMRKHQAYLLDDREMWARIYAQWIATRSGDQQLLAELAISRQPESLGIVRQWDDAEFAPIGAAVDILMRSMQWML